MLISLDCPFDCFFFEFAAPYCHFLALRGSGVDFLKLRQHIVVVLVAMQKLASPDVAHRLSPLFAPFFPGNVAAVTRGKNNNLRCCRSLPVFLPFLPFLRLLNAEN
ncbi:hypothetical protein TRVL_07112 [Trypanosoma vivax]|nr:hypothetical protein TRVL_07112 [Trypanosoma vivax]